MIRLRRTFYPLIWNYLSSPSGACIICIYFNCANKNRWGVCQSYQGLNQEDPNRGLIHHWVMCRWTLNTLNNLCYWAWGPWFLRFTIVGILQTCSSRYLTGNHQWKTNLLFYQLKIHPGNLGRWKLIFEICHLVEHYLMPTCPVLAYNSICPYPHR